MYHVKYNTSRCVVRRKKKKEQVPRNRQPKFTLCTIRDITGETFYRDNLLRL